MKKGTKTNVNLKTLLILAFLVCVSVMVFFYMKKKELFSPGADLKGIFSVRSKKQKNRDNQIRHLHKKLRKALVAYNSEFNTRISNDKYMTFTKKTLEEDYKKGEYYKLVEFAIRLMGNKNSKKTIMKVVKHLFGTGKGRIPFYDFIDKLFKLKNKSSILEKIKRSVKNGELEFGTGDFDLPFKKQN